MTMEELIKWLKDEVATNGMSTEQYWEDYERADDICDKVRQLEKYYYHKGKRAAYWEMYKKVNKHEEISKSETSVGK